jgi:hypothetical protein
MIKKLFIAPNILRACANQWGTIRSDSNGGLGLRYGKLYWLWASRAIRSLGKKQSYKTLMSLRTGTESSCPKDECDIYWLLFQEKNAA